MMDKVQREYVRSYLIGYLHNHLRHNFRIAYDKVYFSVTIILLSSPLKQIFGCSVYVLDTVFYLLQLSMLFLTARIPYC
jgi:hypothetical protein